MAVLSIPRPRGRGPVEAMVFDPAMNAFNGIPRPRGRGPVEAAYPVHEQIWARTFRARAGAAPLKLRLA